MRVTLLRMKHTSVTSPDEGDGIVDPVLFSDSVSELLGGVPKATLRYWDATGRGPKSFKLGKRRAWRRSSVLSWLAEQERATAGGSAI